MQVDLELLEVLHYYILLFQLTKVHIQEASYESVMR